MRSEECSWWWTETDWCHPPQALTALCWHCPLHQHKLRLIEIFSLLTIKQTNIPHHPSHLDTQGHICPYVIQLRKLFSWINIKLYEVRAGVLSTSEIYKVTRESESDHLYQHQPVSRSPDTILLRSTTYQICLARLVNPTLFSMMKYQLQTSVRRFNI